MKLASTGSPSFSVLDGWWWRPYRRCYRLVDRTAATAPRTRRLGYNKLEQINIPVFYNERDRYVDVMCHAIAINGSFFKTPAYDSTVSAEGIFAVLIPDGTQSAFPLGRQ
jgi:starch phosphorylase